MVEERAKWDWINLPPDVAVESLWELLHDGDLLDVRSDLLMRTVTLTIDVAHMRNFYELAEETRFHFTFEGVHSARAVATIRWPGDCSDTRGKSREDESRLIKEYQAKWREESVGWNDFMAFFPVNTLDISNAEIARHESRVALRMGGMLFGDDIDDQFCTLFLQAEAVSIRQSDGVPLTIEQLVKLGNGYWEAWSAERTKKLHETG